MAKISYVNGRYVHHAAAAIHIEDRAHQFSDGVYEVMAFYNRILLDETLHMQRLARSLKEIRITPPMSDKALRMVIREVIARNARDNGTVYIQISRGVAKRDHTFPKHTRASLVITVTGAKQPKAKEVREGVSVITTHDLRWARRDIKSVSLLANVMARQAAAEAGAREAWLIGKDGLISEGSASNAAIVNAKGEVVTSPESHNILGGITRAVVLKLARKSGIKIVEKSFSLKEAYAAKEAFMLGTTANVLPVTTIDGKPVGNGKPGTITMKLLALYLAHIDQETGR